MKLSISPTTETNLKSFAAFIGMVSLTGVIGSAIAGTAGLYLSIGATIALSAATLYFCREIVLFLMGAKEVEPNQKPEGFDLNAMVDRLYQHPNINLGTKPKVCIIDTNTKNAFATGRSQNHTAIAITTGMLKEAREKADNMEQAERWIEAIWCHELGHIINSDIATKTTANILTSALTIMSKNIYEQRRAREEHARRNRSNSSEDQTVQQPSFGQKFAEYALFYWLIPFSGTLLSLCLSRAREFAADDVARQCGKGKDLAEAFDKLLRSSKYGDEDQHKCPHMAAFSGLMCSSLEPEAQSKQRAELQSENIGWFRWSIIKYSQWTSTHPPVDDRIERLLENETNSTSRPSSR